MRFSSTPSEPKLALIYRVENLYLTWESSQTVVNIPNATAWLWEERLGDCSTDTLTGCTFSGVFTCLRRPSLSVLSAFSESSNCLTHIWMVFASETALLRGITNLCQKDLCLSCDQRFVVFEIRLHRKSSMFPVQTIMTTKIGSMTNYNETPFIQLPPSQLE